MASIKAGLREAGFAEDYTEDVVEPLGDELTYGDFSYTVKEDRTVEITGYSGTETDVEIPSEIDGMSVTGKRKMS